MCVLGDLGVDALNTKFPSRSAYDVVRILAAVVLLTAAGLKTHQLATEPILAKTWLDNRWLLMAAVEFELFFGLWLLWNNLPRLTWLAALGCFSLFTCISLYKASAGYTSCGCLGAMKTSPISMSVFDLAMVLAFLICRPHNLPSPRGRGAGGEGGREHGSPANGKAVGGEGGWHSVSLSGLVRHALVVFLAWLPLGLPAAYAMGSYTDTTLSDSGEIVGHGRIVVLEPEKWGGKRFPLLPYIKNVPGGPQSETGSLRERLTEGYWLVVLYHHDCPHCREAMPTFHELARRSATDPESPQLAMIEVPPYGDDTASLTSDIQCRLGRLSDKTEWFIETPAAILLQEGRVTFEADDSVSNYLSTIEDIRLRQ